VRAIGVFLAHRTTYSAKPLRDGGGAGAAAGVAAEPPLLQRAGVSWQKERRQR